jgi:hypothetical protein
MPVVAQPPRKEAVQSRSMANRTSELPLSFMCSPFVMREWLMMQQKHPSLQPIQENNYSL